MSVDDIIARWRAGHYPPTPPQPAEVRRAFLLDVRARCGFDPPSDYVRFLELCDGGQNDASYLFGCAPETRSHLDTGSTFLIGNMGNVDGYVLRPDGRADIANFFGLDEVVESYPRFTALLDTLIRT
jgi:hypothetical protein